jgi:hypothetical protein
MVDHEEWRFGDEPAGMVCPVCGKANRAGQVHCAFCGTPLDAESDSDPLSLRTIGEAMAAGRPERRRRRERPWMFPAAVAALLAAAGGGYWWSRVPERLPWDEDVLSRHAPPRSVVASPVAAPRVESKAEPPPLAAPRPAVVASPLVAMPRPPAATVVPRAVTRPPLAAVRPPAAAPIAPARLVRHATPRAVAPSPVEPEQRAAVPSAPAAERTPSAPPAAAEQAATPPAEQRSGEERPALGTDLVNAQRAYRAAIEAYNARADEYNEIADEVQRGDAGRDAGRVAALHARLELAREAAERARAEADTLWTHVEEVRSKYK